MFKIIVPLLTRNSCKDNANLRTACCIKNFLISPSPRQDVDSTLSVKNNFTQRRHFLFSSTNRKTVAAFPANPGQKHLGVSNRLGQNLELLPTTQSREFRSSVTAKYCKEAADTNPTERQTSSDFGTTSTSKRDSSTTSSVAEANNIRFRQSIFEDSDEENIFGNM